MSAAEWAIWGHCALFFGLGFIFEGQKVFGLAVIVVSCVSYSIFGFTSGYMSFFYFGLFVALVSSLGVYGESQKQKREVQAKFGRTSSRL